METPNRTKTRKATQDFEVAFSCPRLIEWPRRNEIVGQIELAFGNREWQSSERISKKRGNE